MGCSQTKPVAESKSQNNAGFPEPPPPPATDPRLPLNAREKFQITKSWKGISRNMEETGKNMFLKLFESHAELLSLFTQFGDLKKESLQESLELEQHAVMVMGTIDQAIIALDDVDNFLSFLHNVGQSHKKIPGFNADYFWKMEEPFLGAVRETLGDRYSENIERVYKITIKFILETLIKGAQIE